MGQTYEIPSTASNQVNRSNLISSRLKSHPTSPTSRNQRSRNHLFINIPLRRCSVCTWRQFLSNIRGNEKGQTINIRRLICLEIIPTLLISPFYMHAVASASTPLSDYWLGGWCWWRRMVSGAGSRIKMIPLPAGALGGMRKESLETSFSQLLFT